MNEFEERLDEFKECGMVGLVKMPDGTKRYFAVELSNKGFIGGTGDHLDYDLKYMEMVAMDLVTQLTVSQENN